jgi:transcriptional regulator with XRE-family HTH domain
MKSQWYELKENAIALRKHGLSMIKIEKDLGIPRSTLSGWFKNIPLTKKQKKKLSNNKLRALVQARKNAVLWHNAQKRNRLETAEKDARKTLISIDPSNPVFLELALAFLYLGEGSKKNIETALGSSDPKILKLFLAGLKNIYNIDPNKIRCELYLRADQNPDKIKNYWSKELRIPLNNFKQVNIDKRTIGTITYPHYKGVCNLRCGNVAIQRKLVSLANLFCEKITSNNPGV